MQESFPLPKKGASFIIRNHVYLTKESQGNESIEKSQRDKDTIPKSKQNKFESTPSTNDARTEA